jgi:hypothetical protein
MDMTPQPDAFCVRETAPEASRVLSNTERGPRDQLAVQTGDWLFGQKIWLFEQENWPFGQGNWLFGQGARVPANQCRGGSQRRIGIPFVHANRALLAADPVEGSVVAAVG